MYNSISKGYSNGFNYTGTSIFEDVSGDNIQNIIKTLSNNNIILPDGYDCDETTYIYRNFETPFTIKFLDSNYNEKTFSFKQLFGIYVPSKIEGGIRNAGSSYFIIYFLEDNDIDFTDLINKQKEYLKISSGNKDYFEPKILNIKKSDINPLLILSYLYENNFSLNKYLLIEGDNDSLYNFIFTFANNDYFNKDKYDFAFIVNFNIEKYSHLPLQCNLLSSSSSQKKVKFTDKILLSQLENYDYPSFVSHLNPTNLIKYNELSPCPTSGDYTQFNYFRQLILSNLNDFNDIDANSFLREDDYLSILENSKFLFSLASNLSRSNSKYSQKDNLLYKIISRGLTNEKNIETKYALFVIFDHLFEKINKNSVNLIIDLLRFNFNKTLFYSLLSNKFDLDVSNKNSIEVSLVKIIKEDIEKIKDKESLISMFEQDLDDDLSNKIVEHYKDNNESNVLNKLKDVFEGVINNIKDIEKLNDFYIEHDYESVEELCFSRLPFLLLDKEDNLIVDKYNKFKNLEILIKFTSPYTKINVVGNHGQKLKKLKDEISVINLTYLTLKKEAENFFEPQKEFLEDYKYLKDYSYDLQRLKEIDKTYITFPFILTFILDVILSILLTLLIGEIGLFSFLFILVAFLISLLLNLFYKYDGERVKKKFLYTSLFLICVVPLLFALLLAFILFLL